MFNVFVTDEENIENIVNDEDVSTEDTENNSESSESSESSTDDVETVTDEESSVDNEEETEETENNSEETQEDITEDEENNDVCDEDIQDIEEIELEDYEFDVSDVQLLNFFRDNDLLVEPRIMAMYSISDENVNPGVSENYVCSVSVNMDGINEQFEMQNNVNVFFLGSILGAIIGLAFWLRIRTY